MKVIYYNAVDPEDHGQQFQQLVPEAEVRLWREGDNDAADYALVWRPPAAMLKGRSDLKAIFNMGAGVDAILKLNQDIPSHVPIIRIEDAGMGEQMADYASFAVLRYYRQFDLYQNQQERHAWVQKKPASKNDFRLAVLGLGVLGQVIVQRLLALNFPVSGWSRSQKNIDGVRCFSGEDGLAQCLASANAVVSILPLTVETTGILNRATLSHLPKGAFLINVGRGAHVVEEDLLALLQSGHLAGATLDVFQTEPLPDHHPFWGRSDVTITPHISALTLVEEGNAQIAEKLRRLEQGLAVTGEINRSTGY
jgi:glyoxylate/hydroxypyruvate reductase A